MFRAVAAYDAALFVAYCDMLGHGYVPPVDAPAPQVIFCSLAYAIITFLASGVAYSMYW